MALGRVLELTVGANASGLLISDLDVDFKIEKSAVLAENTAEFTVYNAKEATRKKVLRKGNNIICSLGYKDEAVANVFTGNIETSISQKKGSDWRTTIRAYTIQAKTQSLGKILLSLSFSPNTPIATPLQKLADLSGLVLTGIENVSEVSLPNGWVFAGTYTGALRYITTILASYDIGLFMDNNEIVIYKIGEASRYKFVQLNYNGGLLSITDITKAEETKKRVAINSIIIPQLRVNGIAVITDTGSNDGSYIIDRFNMSGNNYGGGWNMMSEGVA